MNKISQLTVSIPGTDRERLYCLGVRAGSENNLIYLAEEVIRSAGELKSTVHFMNGDEYTIKLCMFLTIKKHGNLCYGAFANTNVERSAILDPSTGWLSLYDGSFINSKVYRRVSMNISPLSVGLPPLCFNEEKHKLDYLPPKREPKPIITKGHLSLVHSVK